jgi:hypothetical protein
MNYERSEWAEQAGIWHDVHGMPWKQTDHDIHGYAYWNDATNQYIERDTLPEHALLDALIEIIKELKDELEQLKQ